MEHEKKIPERQEIFASLYSEDRPTARQSRLPAPPAPPQGSPACDLLLVTDGSCKLFLGETQLLLIPGDLLIIGAGQDHRLLPSANCTVYQCFFLDGTAEQELQLLCELHAQRAAYQRSDFQRRLRTLRLFDANPSDITALRAATPAGLQYMSHLERIEMDCIQELLQHILKEQHDKLVSAKQMCRAYLQQLLILLARIRLQQFETDKAPQSWKRELVERVLQEIDQHMAENIDFEEIARQQGITATYFRAVFKSIVGLPPLDYLNRVRIMASLELLQTSDLSIAEIAAQVGISDANYFSRLFKKIIGHPPRYFKAIPSSKNE